MKDIVSLCFLSFIFINGFAQDKNVKNLKETATKNIRQDLKDTIQKTWRTGGSFATNINQGSLSNWSAGGEKFSFSLNSSLDMFGYYKKEKHSWDNSLALAYGIVNTTSLGNRKSSDRMDLTSKYGYALNPKLALSGLVNFRSQFANGYAYYKDMNGKDSLSLTSKTLQPAYILVSPGLDYHPVKNLSIFASPVTARWIVVKDIFLKPIYNVPLNQNVKREIGAFASVNYQHTFQKTLSFKSKLDLFSNYKNNPQNVDVFFTNTITARILKFINFSLQLDLIYDDDTQNTNPGKGPAPQILQLMGVGFAYSFKN